VRRFYALRRWQALVLLALLEIFCVGAGMGVPAFVILLGFPVGWWLGRRATLDQPTSAMGLRDVLRAALVPSAATLVLMAAIWLPQLRMLADPAFDAAQWGIPLWLYTPMASFVGWMVLMVVVSPVLQLLATVFGAAIAMSRPVSEAQGPEHVLA
jgi:hypothetical protein